MNEIVSLQHGVWVSKYIKEKFGLQFKREYGTVRHIMYVHIC